MTLPASHRHIRHVIWDWNGTLLDDAWLCRAVMNQALRRRNLAELDEASYMEAFGFPVIEYYRRVGFDFTRESWEEAATEFIVGYEARRHECLLQADARDWVDRLHQSGIEQSLLSAYRHETLLEIVEKHGLRGFFEHVLGVDDHYADGKLEQGRRLLADLRQDPAQVLLIGDTTHDHEVAEALGVECLLLPRGNHSRERLVATGARVVDQLGVWT